jgi:two-component system response regulator RegA
MNNSNTKSDYLVVDDDQSFRERLVKALSDRGCAVSSADNVQQAKELLAEQSFERIIVDLKMPGASGLELVEFIESSGSEAEVVVLTGYGTIATAKSAIKLGAVNYLTKPASTDEILQAFEEEVELEDVPVPSLSQIEWEHLQRVISDCDGNISQAAKALGMHRRSLQRKLQKSPGLLK